MNFTQEDLLTGLSNASDNDLHAANFGIVKISPTGDIEFYNQYEADLAGLTVEEATGKNFFTEIAPCTNNFLVAHKFQETADSGGSFDETMDYMFTYRLKPTNVKLRLLKDSNEQWICVMKR